MGSDPGRPAADGRRWNDADPRLHGVNGWWVVLLVVAALLGFGLWQRARDGGGAELERARALALGACGAYCYVRHVRGAEPHRYLVAVWRLESPPRCYAVDTAAAAVRAVETARCRGS